MNEAAMDFLLTRRSVPAKTLGKPGPGRAEVERILTAGARVPDHKMLEPWRFIVLEDAALDRLAEVLAARARELGLGEAAEEKVRDHFRKVPLSIVVVASPVETDAIPPVEQTLSAGAACLSVLNAALASGWGANWVTGWAAYDRPFVEGELGLAPHEWVAGFIHIGTAKIRPADRKRPDLALKTRWIEA